MVKLRIPALALPILLSPLCATAQWTLVWSDEFDGPAIDLTKWTHEVNAWGGGNNELQYYTARPENSYIQDGSLRIRAIKETFTGPEGTRGYTSARLNTRYKGDWRYGRVEARAKMPLGQGLWPAIWMLPTDNEYGTWAASGEIDIMEYRGSEPNRIHGTLHYGGQWPQNTYSGSFTDGPNFSEDFHVFALEWDEMEFRWYIDDVIYLTQTNWFSSNGEYPAPFDKRFHLLLNVAVGGNFLQDPAPDADYFPQEMAVDWVRVYERVPQSYFVTPPMLPAQIEAEHYNRGGNGIGYNDLTSAQRGSGFRATESVDIQPTTDAGGGFNVGWVEPGEWLDYTIETPWPGTWAVDVRTASNAGGGVIRFISLDEDRNEIDSVDVTLPHTNGWQNWTTVTSLPLTIPEGSAIVRAEIISGEFNLNWFAFNAVTSIERSFWETY